MNKIRKIIFFKILNPKIIKILYELGLTNLNNDEVNEYSKIHILVNSRFNINSEKSISYYIYYILFHIIFYFIDWKKVEEFLRCSQNDWKKVEEFLRCSQNDYLIEKKVNGLIINDTRNYLLKVDIKLSLKKITNSTEST